VGSQPKNTRQRGDIWQRDTLHPSPSPSSRCRINAITPSKTKDRIQNLTTIREGARRDNNTHSNTSLLPSQPNHNNTPRLPGKQNRNNTTLLPILLRTPRAPSIDCELHEGTPKNEIQANKYLPKVTLRL
jgi:hypothetical protein